MFSDAGTSVSSGLSVNFSHHTGRSRKRFPAVPWLSSFLFWFLVFGSGRGGRRGYRAGFPALVGKVSSLHKLAGLEEVLCESCGNDVEDELAPELDDNPVTTTGTKFSFLHGIFFPFFGQLWLLTTGQLIGISMFFAELSK